MINIKMLDNVYCFICDTLSYKCFNSYKTIADIIIIYVLRMGMQVYGTWADLPKFTEPENN